MESGKSSSLIPVEEAKKKILGRVNASQIRAMESVVVEKAGKRILAENIYSPIDVPFDDNSAMDGFVISSANFKGGERVPVSQYLTAGVKPEILESNTAARIFTGAVIPVNADTVIPQELCELEDGFVVLPEKIEAGKNIRPKGQDIEKGKVLFENGRQISSQDIGLLSSLGIREITCKTKVRVGILCTGDELLDPGEKMESGKVYNSNRYLLQALLENIGCEIADIRKVKDDEESLSQSLKMLSKTSDCIISSGGASVGDSDLMKKILSKEGRLDIWRLAIKPGKPFMYGEIEAKPFFGLPGNPVAVFVTFLFLVKPALLALMGATRNSEFFFKVKISEDLKINNSRQEYLRVSLVEKEGEQFIEPYRNQSSGVLSSTAFSDGVAVVPIAKEIRQGDLLDFYPFTGLLD